MLGFYECIEVTITGALILSIPIMIILFILFDDVTFDFEWEGIMNMINNWRK